MAAVDTRNKRGSTIPGVQPQPDGTINAGDRAQVTKEYRGQFDPTGGTSTGEPAGNIVIFCRRR